MKKVILGIILIAIILMVTNVAIATEGSSMTLQEQNANDILNTQNNVNEKLNEYVVKYESQTYGLAAYILDSVRIYSIPVCFIGIVVGALNQYVLGTRRLDKKRKGYGIIMTFVTLLVVCQVLPLIFTIVVIGWRG